MIRGRASLALAVLTAVAGTLGVPREARAEFCRSKACDTDPAYDDVWQTEPDPACTRNATDCIIEGNVLFWPSRCISFSIQKDGSKQQGIDFELIQQTVQRAFGTWLDADCGGGSKPGFALGELSPVSCEHIEYNETDANANTFLFLDDVWPHQLGTDTLALTTVTYNPETGEIYDADVEINSARSDFTFVDDAAETSDDLLGILTHECGHFLGLSHDTITSPDPVNGPTMYWKYNTGDLYQRTLNADDEAGICAIYPPADTVSTSECEPRHGFSAECGVEHPKATGCGCSVASTRRDATLPLFVMLGLGSVFWRRATRARRRPLRHGTLRHRTQQLS